MFFFVHVCFYEYYYYQAVVLNLLTNFCHIFLILSEELRSAITQDACMCDAQIMFQKKVQAAIRELNKRHILFAWNT